MINKWVCFLVNNNFLRRYKRSVEDEMRRVFGKDYLAFDIMPESAEDVYAFVRIRDYAAHLDSFKSNASVKSVLPSAENPYFISDEEVQKFIESATPCTVVQHFRVGDIVRVQSGWLKNLVGLVVSISPHDRYSVLFKFHIRQFRRVMKAQDLVGLSNLFSSVRIPISSLSAGSSYLENLESSENERDKRRPMHRKHGKQKK